MIPKTSSDIQTICRGTQKQVIGLAGPCGVGKSTLARYAETFCNVGVVHEPVLDNLLREYDRNPTLATVQLQESIISLRAEGFLKLSNDLILLDRSIAEDREIFFPLHYMKGSLSRDDIQRLLICAEKAEAMLESPCAFIVLTADEIVLKGRAMQDGRPQWLVDSLGLQIDLYRKWLETLTVPFLVVDTTHRTLSEVCLILRWALESIEEVLSGRLPLSEDFGIIWQRN